MLETSYPVYFDVWGPGKLDWRPATCPSCGFPQLFHKLFRIPKEECHWRLPRTPLYLLEGCSIMIQDNKIFNNTIRRRYEARKQLEATRRAQHREVKVNQHLEDAQEDKIRGTRNPKVIDKDSQEANLKPEDEVTQKLEAPKNKSVRIRRPKFQRSSLTQGIQSLTQI